MAKNSRNNMRKYRKPINLNAGMIIFSIIFIYIIICIFMYFTSKHIIGYEVKLGTLSVSNTYRGMALREEQVVDSTKTGYVNYYAREGERVGVGNLVYSVDETGKLKDYLNDSNLGENSLSDTDLTQLKSDIVSFQKNFNSQHFNSVYDFKYDLKGNVLKYGNINVLSTIQNISGNSTSDLVNLSYANDTGVVVYNIDQLETITMDNITPELLDESTYEKQQLISNDLIDTGEPVYKLITSEIWSIVVPISKERAEELNGTDFVQVKFLKNQNISWGKVSIFNKQDQYFANLEFNNSMISFCTDRFIDIELITEEEVGLKIPNSAIVEKEFYLVPKDYIVKGGDGNQNGVMKETYKEDGTMVPEFLTISIYNESDTEVYVDENFLQIGDYLIKSESNEKYPISKKGTLIGVYNINKGYADFKQVLILYQNEEYSIVQSNTNYGLSVYDHIVLDSTTVNEDDFIY